MIKLIHIADLHLDTPFTGSGFNREQALQRRIDILENFQDCIEIANERKADAVLIAGDLFEEEYLRIRTFQRAMATISNFDRGPVIITPGNHDPFHPGSPYATEKLPENLIVFSKNQIEKLVFKELKLDLYGLAFVTPHLRKEIWKGFKVDPTASDYVQVMLTHGAVYQGDAGRAGNYLPLFLDDLKDTGADYIALGHYHTKQDLFTDPFTGSIRCAYPGSPEPLRAGTKPDHGMILATIDPVSKTANVERIVTQKRRYHKVELDLDQYDSISDIDTVIDKTLQNVEYKGDMLEIVLRGKVPPDTVFDPADYRNLAHSLFYLKFDNRLNPDYDFEAISHEETARGEFCRRVLDKIERSEPAEKDSLENILWLGLLAFDGQDVEDIPL